VRKYLHVFNIGVQNTLVYRVNFLFRATFGLVPLAAILFVWRAIYEGKGEGGEVAGYPLSQMISYYLVVTLVDMTTAVTEDDWQIAADIREGTISQFLLKPIDYLAYRFTLFLSGRAIYTACAIVPVGCFILYLREHFILPPDWTAAGGFALSVLMTATLQFLISYTMALLAFWILEIATVIFILFAFEYVAGGHMFPLDILPPALRTALELTPFPYLLYFPVSVYLGRATGPALVSGLCVQAIWIVLAYCLARFVWSRGIRKYGAYGG
jgi:ABC-2 type transport system permease protein